jgi:HlyD family secretion protein
MRHTMKLKVLSSKWLMMALMGLLLFIAVLFVMRRAGPLAPVRITVTQATEGSFSPALYGIGLVEARRSYSLGPTVAGRVLRVLVDVGDTVQSGQLLAEMDPVDLDNRLLALDASLARAASGVVAAQAQTADMDARKELASISTRRYVELGHQNFVSSGAVEAKLQEQVSAQAGANSAQANLAAARHEVLRVKAERAAIVQQRQNVRLIAAQDGVVTSREVEPGATVVAGQPVLRYIDPGSLWVKARFDQGRSSGLAPGLSASIALRSSAATQLSGKVVRVDLQGDSVTEERGALIAVDGLPAGTPMGELAEVTLQLPEISRSVLLPNAAIRRFAAQTGVWVIRQDALQFAPLRLGHISLEGQVQVLDGLKAGELVVVYSEKDIDAATRFEVVKNLVASKGAQGAP